MATATKSPVIAPIAMTFLLNDDLALRALKGLTQEDSGTHRPSEITPCCGLQGILCKRVRWSWDYSVNLLTPDGAICSNEELRSVMPGDIRSATR